MYRASVHFIRCLNWTRLPRVTGHDGNAVEMHATETVRGDLQADIERARAQMRLLTETEPGRVAFRVRRTDEDRDGRGWGLSWDGYSIEYDIEVRVPRRARSRFPPSTTAT